MHLSVLSIILNLFSFSLRNVFHTWLLIIFNLFDTLKNLSTIQNNTTIMLKKISFWRLNYSSILERADLKNSSTQNHQFGHIFKLDIYFVSFKHPLHLGVTLTASAPSCCWFHNRNNSFYRSKYITLRCSAVRGCGWRLLCNEVWHISCRQAIPVQMWKLRELIIIITKTTIIKALNVYQIAYESHKETLFFATVSLKYTVGIKIIRTLGIIHVKKVISNAVLRDKYLSDHAL